MTMEQIKRIKGVFNGPPGNFPTGASTGAAVVGNGDVLVAMGGAADKITFQLSKLDFWQAWEDAGRGGGAKTIGALTLSTPVLGGASYLLEQSIHDATVCGRFEKDGAALSVTVWTPRGENVLVVELRSVGNVGISIQPAFTIQDGSESVVESGRAGGIAWHERRFEESNLMWKTGVTVAMRTANGDTVRLEPGQKHTLVLAVVTNHDSPDHRARAVAMAQAFDERRLAEARSRHLEWWKALWQKCSKIEIGDAYLEDRYYGSHYIIASCCGNRSFPPGLFAWITNDYPGWGSDYHTNYNYEAPWWGVLTSNLVELAEPYDQAIMDYLPRMQAYAKRFLNVRGAYCNVGFGPKGIHVDRSATPYDDGLNFLGQKSNSSFLAVNMIMRYHLTQDLEYARRYAYPYIVEVMNFWEDYLTFEPFDGAQGRPFGGAQGRPFGGAQGRPFDRAQGRPFDGAQGKGGRYVIHNDCINECGFYMMLPEDSPEFQRAKESNPILSLGLIRLLSKAAIDISTALGVDEPRRGKWKHILDHISEFPLTERNGKTMFDVCENGITKLEDLNMCCIQHIYPANGVSLSSDPLLVRAGVDTILYKDLWENLNSFSTVFAAAARVGVDPDLILQQMNRVTEKYIQPNFMFNMGGGGIENSSG
ncbi:MAG: hypothetical protein WCP86_05150, partial [bacterium]